MDRSDLQRTGKNFKKIFEN